MEDPNFLTPIQTALEPFDPFDLVVGFSALQLVPENAHHLIRLKVAAAAGAAPAPRADLPSVSNQRWRVIANSSPVADASLVNLEDPVVHLFTEAFTFHGGSY